MTLSFDGYSKAQLEQIETNNLLSSMPRATQTLRNIGLKDNEIIIIINEAQLTELTVNSKAYLLKAKHILELRSKNYSNSILSVEGKKDSKGNWEVTPIGSGVIIPSRTIRTRKGKIYFKEHQENTNGIMYESKSVLFWNGLKRLGKASKNKNATTYQRNETITPNPRYVVQNMAWSIGREVYLSTKKREAKEKASSLSISVNILQGNNSKGLLSHEGGGLNE